MPLYDYRCEKCDHLWEQVVPASEVKDFAPECPECHSFFTNLVWTKVPVLDKAKDPYDYLHGYRPSSKPVKSFANDRRKGGKDTT